MRMPPNAPEPVIDCTGSHEIKQINERLRSSDFRGPHDGWESLGRSGLRKQSAEVIARAKFVQRVQAAGLSAAELVLP
jgi:hypothetical protein